MKISVLTLFPGMISGFFSESIVKRAQDKNLVQIEMIDLRKYAVDDYGTVDDKPYGGGVGMIMRLDVIYSALSSVTKKTAKSLNSNVKTIITSPQGKVFNQLKAQEYSKLDHLTIIAGHYEGVDERVNDFVDEEVSVGDFVMTGGEIAASAIVDSTVRLIPGVLKKEDAIVSETFMEVSISQLINTMGENKFLQTLRAKGINSVKLLEYPQYTRPEKFKGQEVPAILLSGNHKEIEDWRLRKAFEETIKKRPDLLQ